MPIAKAIFANVECCILEDGPGFLFYSATFESHVLGQAHDIKAT